MNEKPFDNRPIGVFDSGVGGLTVLDHIVQLLPGESTVYLGDTARVPYGTRSADTVTRYSLECAQALVARAGVKVLVVACNTASAVALPLLASTFSVPVIGVIEAGARAALEASRGGAIAILATTGTTRSGAYLSELRRLGAECEVIGRACPLLVPLVEEGWVDGVVPLLTLDRYISDLVGRADVIVLGCTHYPRMRSLLRQLLPAAVAVVDGGVATAAQLQAVLSEQGLLAQPGRVPNHRIWVTDAVEAMVRMAPDFLRIDMSEVNIEHVEIATHG